MVIARCNRLGSDLCWSREFAFSCTGAAPSPPDDAEQLDFELQRRVGRDHAARSALAVRARRRAGQLGLAADLDALHTFGPALDHAVERELRRLAARVGAVELLAVGKGAAVVHAHLVACLWGRAGA